MQKKTSAVLYYVHDPMCSWCWGFRPVWLQVKAKLKDTVNIRYLLGGLADDSDQPMPVSMQKMIESTWLKIEQDIPGTKFNYDFWRHCKPRRSTYPACRAIIAAQLQGKRYSVRMLTAIQHAYYQQAKNPSNTTTLIQLSADIGLNVEKFKNDFFSDKCNDLFQQQMQHARGLGVSSFPSLVLSHNQSNTMIHIDYNNDETIVSSILALI
ncbi:MAG: DsbA family protein [Gammaproteobacteria bacterium]|nr:DsbA family protein [Gammaproteobacteria bacterium]